MRPLGSKLLALLQFTRAGLVFTAIADTMCALLLRAGSWQGLQVLPAALALATSACLYAFGMSLNDLVDHRRDKLLAATRPIPSGRLGVYSAHVIVSALALAALTFGGLYALLIGSSASFAFLLLTLLLINFYNFAGKYLVSAGILTLGLIRFFHVLIAAPDLPVVWHPLWLFTHVVVITVVAYSWEEKRPRITPVHSALLIAGVLLTNIVTVAVYLSLGSQAGPRPRGLHLGLPIVIPIASTIGFFLLARAIGHAVGPGSPPSHPVSPTPQVLSESAARPESQMAPLRTRRRQAGQRVILAGLLWLILHDAAFVFAFVGWAEASVILLLLPIAYGAVRIMRGWSRVVQLTKPSQFRTSSPL